jgi:sugar lactone lactonase YvrE
LSQLTGSLVGFNPQPEPPSPGSIVGFNPQPEPPVAGGALGYEFEMGTGVAATSSAGAETITLSFQLLDEFSTPIALSLVASPPNTVIADPKLYWVDTALQEVGRSDLDGNNVEIIATTPNPVNGVAVDPMNDVVYWIECCGSINSRIRRADAGGGNEVTINTATTFGFPPRILLDPTNQYLYISEGSGSGNIKRVNTDGTGLLTLSGTATRGLALDAINNKVYWTEGLGGDAGIHRMNLNGSSPEAVFTTANGDPIADPEGIAIDAADDHMYWLDAAQVLRAKLDGTAFEVLADFTSHGVQAPKGIAIDLVAQKLYWTDTTRHTITRSDLDGSNAVDIITTGLIFPRALALVPEPNALLSLISGLGLLILLSRRRRS